MRNANSGNIARPSPPSVLLLVLLVLLVLVRLLSIAFHSIGFHSIPAGEITVDCFPLDCIHSVPSSFILRLLADQQIPSFYRSID
jgi:hypothetical protein